jgi:uncharacterized protein with HEPN domain
MRREELYLRDIVEAIGHLTQFIAGLDRLGFHKSELVRSAVVQKLVVIGEAAARVSDELKARYPHVPWPRIVAFRNLLVHAYFGIDWDEVWRAATRESPVLRSQIETILRAGFGEESQA